MQTAIHLLLQLLATVLAGAAAASVVYLLYGWWVDHALQQRLSRISSQGGTIAAPLSRSARNRKVGGVVSLLSSLSLPDEGWQDSKVRLRFLQAGIRNRNAPVYYFALKSLLTLVLPLLLALFLQLTQPQLPFTRVLLFVVLTAAAGYYLPELLLRLLIARRVERMRNGLPDMMDLMVVCAESGMSVDSATARISREMARTSPELSQEFYLSALEMRAGATRIEALQNLALRSRLDELHDLVSVLAQAEKYGTSLADSLRTQSDMMRSKRTQRAEELAAKIPVKMVMPLVLFVFPSVMIVMLGPAVIRIMEAFSR